MISDFVTPYLYDSNTYGFKSASNTRISFSTLSTHLSGGTGTGVSQIGSLYEGNLYEGGLHEGNSHKGNFHKGTPYENNLNKDNIRSNVNEGELIRAGKQNHTL